MKTVIARFAVAAALLGPSMLWAQSGITYDFTLNEKLDRQRLTSAGHGRGSPSNSRMDVIGPSSLSRFASVSLGDSITLISVDTGASQVLALIGHRKREYVQFHPVIVREQIKARMDQMLEPVAWRMDFAGSKVTLDSLGDGGLISGFRILHYRMTIVLRLAVAGRDFGNHNVVADYYIAPELAEFVHANSIFNTANDPSGELPGIPKSLSDELESAFNRLQVGLALRVERRTSGVMRGRRISKDQTLELTNIKRADVPSSAFVVPEGYKRITPPGMEEVMR